MDTSPTSPTPLLKWLKFGVGRRHLQFGESSGVLSYRRRRQIGETRDSLGEFSGKLFLIEDKILLWLFGLFVHRGLRSAQAVLLPCSAQH